MFIYKDYKCNNSTCSDFHAVKTILIKEDALTINCALCDSTLVEVSSGN